MRPVRFDAANAKARIDTRALASTLKTILTNWGQMDFRERFVMLTAGLDTRSVLAAASAANISVQTYTNKNPNLARHDRDLPPRLAACVGSRHRFVSDLGLALDEVKARESAVIEHMDGATFHPVFGTFATGRSDLMNDNGRTTAGGHAFEIGRCFFWDKFSRAGLTEMRPSADQLLRAFFFSSPDPLPFWRDAMQAWIARIRVWCLASTGMPCWSSA